MEAYSVLRKPQYLVLLLFLSLPTNIFGTPNANAQIQPLHIRNSEDTSNDGPNSFQLAYLDDNIALFFEPADRKIIPQLVFTPVAETDKWKFQDKINYSTPNGNTVPTVYVIRHEATQSNLKKMQNSHLYNSQKNISTIVNNDANGLNPADNYIYTSKKSKSRCEAEKFKASLAKVYEPEIQSVLKWEILDILVYDNFLQMKNSMKAQDFLEEVINTARDFPVKNTTLFSDWYLPIYTNHGGSESIKNFMHLLKLNSNGNNTNNYLGNATLNTGEFIHIWSEATATDLRDLAYNAFKWSPQHSAQFKAAQKSLTTHNHSDASQNLSLYTPPLFRNNTWRGTTKNLTRVYSDEHVTFHHDKSVPASVTWPSQSASDSSRNAQNTYETRTWTDGVPASIGLVCVALAAALTPCVVYLIWFKLNVLQEQIRELSTDEVREFFEGSDAVHDDDVNLCIESKPFNVDYEIERERLYIDFNCVMGSGEFGVVFRGMLKPILGPGREPLGTLVAVKTAKPNVNVTHFKTILTELKVMAFLGSHANIVSLLGACTVNIRSREVFMTLEFCSQGDLRSFLKINRAFFTNSLIKISETTETELPIGVPVSSLSCESKIGVEVGNEEFSATKVQDANKTTDVTQNSSEPPTTAILCGQGLNQSIATLSTFELLEWSLQIASGMDYIASKNVIHGDLAARNVLLTAENVAKISDFGLSRQLANYSTYMQTSKTPVPWRWMAIESLRDMSFSVQSDAWSFGVVLYEIFTLGTIPYAGWTWDYKFIDKLVAGHRLSAPEYGNEDIYKLMMDCMQKEPSQRTTFSQIICRLEEIKVKICSEATPNASSNYIQLERIDV